MSYSSTPASRHEKVCDHPGGTPLLFFLSSCQIHLAMAPWGATDGRATVPLDPVEDGKFGRQPFFFPKQNKATEQPNHEPSSKYLIELRINYTREPRNCYESSPVHASNYLQGDCTQTTGCIVCDEKWLDVLCCITSTRGNGSVNY